MSFENNQCERELDEFLSSLEEHNIFKNNYFNHLTAVKWTPDTYELYRANFFYRTELTVKGIAHVCARASEVNDMDTLILFAYILGEETGMGNKAHCHELFMENALNLFGATEFGVLPLKVVDAKKSPLIIPETLAYREKILDLITGSYQRMLGVAMALETHADQMLTTFREAFRLTRRKMDVDTFKHDVEVYFNAHVDNGVEERHAADARQCVKNNCQNLDDLNEIIFGANEMLKIQQSMWDAMYNNTLKLESGTVIVEGEEYA